MYPISERTNDHETAWMTLKCTVLNEKSQTQKPTYCEMPLTWHSGTGKAIGTKKKKKKKKKKRSVLTSGWGWGWRGGG